MRVGSLRVLHLVTERAQVSFWDRIYHQCLRNIGFTEWNSSQAEQHIYQTGVLPRRSVVEVSNETQSGVGAAQLEAVFQADRQSMKWASQLTSLAEGIKMLSPLQGLLEEYFGEARRLNFAVSHNILRFRQSLNMQAAVQ